jgi:thioredoxin reductase
MAESYDLVIVGAGSAGLTAAGFAVQLGALFALNMLVSTPAGDTYTFEEINGSLETAGFDKVEMIMTGEKMDCLMEARKLK